MIVAEYTIPGIHVRDHEVVAPLDWSRPHNPEQLTVFARELADPERRDEDLPLLLFLQGGPGGQGPRPGPGGWWRTALETHRIILLDQRGTGRSTAVDSHRIATYDDARQAADYLACFRGDAIIADAELLRNKDFDGRKWSTLGQSYGGFLTLIYLSRAPEALERCYITGGLPDIAANADDVYKHTYPRMAQRNRQYYQQFPADLETVTAIADHLVTSQVTLPTGDPLTVERFQMLGMPFGMSYGFDNLHWILDTAWSHGRGTNVTHEATAANTGADGLILSDAFLASVAAETSFDINPLYMVLQEVIYAQGDTVRGWAAHRIAADYPEFSQQSRPLFFTGEMAYPWMFEQHQALRPFRAATEALAARTEWPVLYDLDRLSRNEVPVAAVQYYDDPYVDLDLAMNTADRVGNMKVWTTSEYLHDGLRTAGDKILPRLFDMGAGRI